MNIKKYILSGFTFSVVATIAISGGCSGNNSETVSETITAEDLQMAGFVAQSGDNDSDQIENSDSPEDTDTTAPDVSDTGAVSVQTADTLLKEPPRQRVRTSGRINYAEFFNDSNHYQLQHAQRLGIEPITDLRSYYHNKRPLVKIATNEDYVLDHLTHSYPYLVPEADRLLHDIGRNFRDSLKSKGAKDYRIIVTSVLRTPATVKKLRRVNRNATELSTHQYATTFDLSYNKFAAAGGIDDVSYADLKSVLAEVLADLHQEGRCMVKYEKKSPCFHITVVR